MILRALSKNGSPATSPKKRKETLLSQGPYRRGDESPPTKLGEFHIAPMKSNLAYMPYDYERNEIL